MIVCFSSFQLVYDLLAGDFNVGENLVSVFNGMMISDLYSNFFNILYVLAALFTLFSGVRYLEREKLNYPEYYLLILFSTFGMMLMSSSLDLVVIFIALEIMSLSVYSLVGFRRADRKSNEASLKYFVLGGAASAVYLYGVALVYGSVASTRLGAIFQAATEGQNLLPTFTIGCWLIVAGFLFKVASVPFHMWMPDVYEGAPTPITGFMTTGLKAASFATFIRIFLSFGYGHEAGAILSGASHAMAETLRSQFATILWISAVLTMVVGNFAALMQTNVKRILAYSSIAHTGYLLVGMVAATHVEFSSQATSAIITYLVAYSVMNLGAFGLLTILAQKNDSGLNLHHLSGLSRKSPLLSMAFALFMFSMAGIPPTVGFLGKYYLFYSAIQAGETALVVISVLCSVVSVYYYLRIMVYLYMREPGQDTSAPLICKWAVAGTSALAVLTIYFGLMPSAVLELTKSAANNLTF